MPEIKMEIKVQRKGEKFQTYSYATLHQKALDMSKTTAEISLKSVRSMIKIQLRKTEDRRWVVLC